jgi:hypothetical protein
MPVIKPKIAKKKTAKKTKKLKKPVSQALVKAKTLAKKTKNPVAYFGCMKACCQKGIKPKKISQVAHECKTNALTINAKMSAQKTQAAKKIKAGYEQLGQGLSEFIKANK